MSSNSVSPIVGRYDELLKTLKPNYPFVLGPRTLTYGQLFDQVPRMATLFARLGMTCGDRIAIVSNRELAVIPIFFSSLRCGITATVLNPRSSRHEFEVVLGALEPSAIFADHEIVERSQLKGILNGSMRIICIEDEKPQRSLFGNRSAPSTQSDSEMLLRYPAMLQRLEPIAALPSDLPDSLVTHITFTSGTTSRPKGVELTHRAVFGSLANTDHVMGYDSETRVLNPFPMLTTFALSRPVAGTFMLGATIVRPIRATHQGVAQLLDSIYFYRVTHLYAGPSLLSMMLALGQDHRDAFHTEDFRCVVCGGAPLDSDLWDRFEKTFGTTIVNAYGLTETQVVFRSGPRPETRKLGTVGKPFNCEAKIVSGTEHELAPGVVGEIAIRTPFVMKGYFRMPEATAAVLRDGWFYTGDLGSKDEDGFLSVVGRTKNDIIREGINLNPDEITNVLLKLPGVMDVVTVGMPDKVLGERVVSCVVPLPDSTLTDEALKSGFLEYASPDLIPDEIHLMHELPLEAAGKVAINQLKKTLEELRARDVRERQGLERRIFSIAAHTFMVPVDALSPASTPQTVKNWDSVAHVRFILEIEQQLNTTLSPKDVMAIHCLRDAVQVVESLAKPTAAADREA